MKECLYLIIMTTSVDLIKLDVCFFVIIKEIYLKCFSTIECISNLISPCHKMLTYTSLNHVLAPPSETTLSLSSFKHGNLEVFLVGRHADAHISKYAHNVFNIHLYLNNRFLLLF